MRLSKILRRLAAAFALLLLACAFVLWVRPPDLLRVGANYSAKIVCSNVFLAGRDPDEVLRTDVQAPGVGLLRLMRVSVDRERRVVRAGLLGFIGDGLAMERPGNGCTVVPDGNLSIARRVRLGAAAGDRTPAGAAPGSSADGAADWPIGNAVAMSSGLRFNEAYGAVSDVTRMLYLEPDMAGFARAQPLAHPAGEFWSYSSGTANILSRIVQDAAGRFGAEYPAEKLFRPLGMTSATMETDESGTLVGSSYMYATARDWARYGQFLLQDGVWRGQELLPRGFVGMMAAPVAASGGQYGHGLVWLWDSDAVTPGIPADTFWMEGHDGQSTAIIPSRDLVIVRLGLTPSRVRYTPQRLVRAVLQATK
ncbi:MAG: serine hydrolase [Steroidobacteraceae bacterium]